MDISTYEATGATAANSDIARRIRVADSASRITFAANEDLGGGLKAGVYCETGINIDNASSTGQADTGNTNTTTLCSREGRAYFGNNTGEIRLGRQNVWWTQGNLNEVGANLLGSDTLTNLINGGVGVYTVRGENQAKLVAGQGLGSFAGSEFYWGYMGNSGSVTNVTNTGESSATRDGKYHGLKVNYAQGALFAMLDYQNSTNSSGATPAAVGLDRKATKLGVGYHYATGSKVSLQYWRKQRTAVAVGSSTDKDHGYGITLNHDIGGDRLLVAQWGKASDRDNSATGTANDSGATGYTLGALQRMSKRTHFYLSYHKINNGANAAYNMAGGNYASGTPSNGADVKMYAIGMIHNF